MCLCRSAAFWVLNNGLIMLYTTCIQLNGANYLNFVKMSYRNSIHCNIPVWHSPLYFSHVVVHDVGHGCCQLLLDVSHLVAIYIGNHHCVAIILIMGLSHQTNHFARIDLSKKINRGTKIEKNTAKNRKYI